jgi:hypothetical protein
MFSSITNIFNTKSNNNNDHNDDADDTNDSNSNSNSKCDVVINNVTSNSTSSLLHRRIHDLFDIIMSGLLYGIKCHNVDRLDEHYNVGYQTLWPRNIIESCNDTNLTFNLLLHVYIRQNNPYPHYAHN